MTEGLGVGCSVRDGESEWEWDNVLATVLVRVADEGVFVEMTVGDLDHVCVSVTVGVRVRVGVAVADAEEE